MKIRRVPYRDWLDQFQKDSVFMLKMAHINNVVEFVKIISIQLGLPKEDKELAIFIAQHHDDGRFIQWRDYKTFRDGAICSNGKKHPHTELGLEVLFGDGNIKKYAPEITDEECKVAYKAIEQHSSLNIDPSGLSDRELLHCKIIRDADMLDNLVNVMVKETIPILLECRGSSTQELWASEISDEVFETFVYGQSISYDIVETPAEWWLTMIGYLYNLSFKESVRIVKETRCVEKIFDRVDGKFLNCQTNNKIKLAYVAADAYINGKILV